MRKSSIIDDSDPMTSDGLDTQGRSPRSTPEESLEIGLISKSSSIFDLFFGKVAHILKVQNAQRSKIFNTKYQ